MDDAEAIEYISIHAPARGSDDCCKNNTKMSKNFNPRSPQGGATEYNRLCGRGRTYFNPRSPQGGATPQGIDAVQCSRISIHAPHEGERRFPLGIVPRGRINFNPRSLRGGSDYIIMTFIHTFGHFNPRSPRGGATNSPIPSNTFDGISIHAPHEGERLRQKSRR